MEPIEWSPVDMVTEGFEKLKADPMGLMLPVLAVTLISLIPTAIMSGVRVGVNIALAEASPMILILAGLFINLVSMAFGLVVSAWLSGGMVTLWLKVVRGQEYGFSDIFSGGRFFIPMFLTLLLVNLGVGAGSLLCLVPGIIIALGFAFSMLLVVDRGLSPIDALKESWRITDGHKVNLFVLMLLGIVVGMVGMSACCVGVIPAMVIIGVAQVSAYERLSGSLPAPPPQPVGF